MLLNEYHERLTLTTGEFPGSPVFSGQVSWVLIAGTSGQVIGQGYTQVFLETSQTVVPRTVDAVLEAADPSRMKKVTGIMLKNYSASTHRVTLNHVMDDIVAEGWSGLVPAGGSAIYDGAWQIYDADGKRVEITAGATGPTGPAGADGATGPTGPTGSDGWTYHILAANFANSTVTPSDVTGMNFAVAANTKYEVEVFGVYQTAAATTGVGMSMSAPAGSSLAMYMLTPISATASGSTLQRTGSDPTGATASVDTLNADVPLFAKGMVNVANTAGTVQLRWRSEVAASAATLIGSRVFLKHRVVA